MLVRAKDGNEDSPNFERTLRGQTEQSPAEFIASRSGDYLVCPCSVVPVRSLYKILGFCLLPQQSFDVPAAPENMKNQHVLLFNEIDDDIPAHGKTTQTGTQMPLSLAT